MGGNRGKKMAPTSHKRLNNKRLTHCTDSLNEMTKCRLPVCWNFNQSRDIEDLAQRSIRNTIVWLRPAFNIPMACPRCSVVNLAMKTNSFTLPNCLSCSFTPAHTVLKKINQYRTCSTKIGFLYPGLRAQWIATNQDNGVYGHKDNWVEQENPKFRVRISSGSKVTAENFALAVWARPYKIQ